MLNLNYNIQGRSRSILIIITLLGGFFSVFYYTILFPDSRFNIPVINYAVTALYLLLFVVVYFVKDQQKIRRIEELYTGTTILVFLYNALVVLSADNPQAYLAILLLLVASLALSIDRYFLQRVFLFFSSVVFVGVYLYLTPNKPYFLVLYFMFSAMLSAYIFFAKRAIARVSTLSLNFERFINNELSGYVFLDTKKKKWIYQNDKAKQLWADQNIDFLLKVSEEKSIEDGQLRFSVILKKKNHTIYRIDDITKERNSIESYNHIFQKNLAGVYETMLDGTIIVANDSFAKIFGYDSKEEIINENVTKFYKDPKDRAAFLDHIKKEKFLTNFEAIQINKNGKEFYVLNNIVYNEEKNSLSGIVIDITAKKEHEKHLIEEKEKSQIAFDEGTLKLKGIFEGLKNAQVYTLDESYKIISINETAKSAYIAYGGTKLEAGVSYIWYWETCFEPEYIEELKSLINQAFEGRSQYVIGKFNTNNGERWIESYINPIYSTKGDIKEVSIISNDITEKQEYEKKLKDSIEEKDILLREVHHRVKNNLQVISSILSLQSNYVEDSNILNILSESQNRIKTMSFIHESLYQTKNFVEIRFKEHLEKLINNLIYSYSVEKDKIQIESDIEDLGLELDLAIPLGLIVNEIISNSLKHAFKDRDKGKILIQMKKKEGKIELLLQDDGVGMNPDMDIYDSNTLGLQLIITLVDQIDGTISIENSEGTKFLIIFAP